tara:strand:- start:461 stop:1051 length:591 start_codon:yes stop_codon:yes gene_type:complete
MSKLDTIEKRLSMYKEGVESGHMTEREGQLMGYTSLSQFPLTGLEIYEHDPITMLDQLDIRLEHWDKVKMERPRGKNRTAEMLLTRRDAKVTRIFKNEIEKAEEAVKALNRRLECSALRTLKSKKLKKKKKKKETKKKKIARMLSGKTPPGGWDMLGELTPDEIMRTSRWGGKSKKKRKKRRRRKTRKMKKRKKRN